MGPGDLAEALCGLSFVEDASVLVGLERPDDAGVYRLTDEVALVQTVDFFTPVVDDAALFGRIAAANALSDVWAMGGRPVCAMNVVCFPSGEMETEVLRRILAGGLEALREAEVALVGGHSVEAPELKYGLSVTGVVHPERFLTSAGARPGDRLVLTKPVGTGVIATAVKGGLAGEEAARAAAASMSALNRRAAELMLAHAARACTDVTGFGLLGHACEMVACSPEGSQVGLVIESGSVPLLPRARELTRMGLLPAGLHRNRDFYADRVEIAAGVPEPIGDLLCDPQTSGGLMVALEAGPAEAFVAALRSEGVGQAASSGQRRGPDQAAVIGDFVAEHPGRVVVNP